jgi:hypothetical protein
MADGAVPRRLLDELLCWKSCTTRVKDVIEETLEKIYNLFCMTRGDGESIERGGAE